MGCVVVVMHGRRQQGSWAAADCCHRAAGWVAGAGAPLPHLVEHDLAVDGDEALDGVGLRCMEVVCGSTKRGCNVSMARAAMVVGSSRVYCKRMQQAHSPSFQCTHVDAVRCRCAANQPTYSTLNTPPQLAFLEMNAESVSGSAATRLTTSPKPTRDTRGCGRVRVGVLGDRQGWVLEVRLWGVRVG